MPYPYGRSDLLKKTDITSSNIKVNRSKKSKINAIPKGPLIKPAELNEEARMEIRDWVAAGMSMASVARCLNLSQSAVQRICGRRKG